MVAIADGLSTTSTEPEVALWRDANLLAIKGLLQYQQENYQEGGLSAYLVLMVNSVSNSTSKISSLTSLT